MAHIEDLAEQLQILQIDPRLKRNLSSEIENNGLRLMQALQRTQKLPEYQLTWLMSSRMRAQCFCASNSAAKIVTSGSRMDVEALLPSIAKCGELTRTLVAELKEPVYDLPRAETFHLEASPSAV